MERFSNLHTGQVSTIDAKISLDLITESAAKLVPNAVNLLDVGCGAGNYTLMMLSKLPNLNCTRLDLSEPMLARAMERVTSQTGGAVKTICNDIREADLEQGTYDIILAGAVLHHLRDDADWETTFTKLYKLLKPGGCLMISDLVTQETDAITGYIWERYGDYLEGVNGVDYRKLVLDYIAMEVTPRSMTYQLDLMKQVGFSSTEILHKNMCFGAFGGVK